jgi:hypothetical protein
MRGRFRPVTPPALLATLLLLALSPTARAHRLEVTYRILPDHKIEVEGYYYSPANPHPARQARVIVHRADGSTLAEGELDAQGLFTFTCAQPESLTVVVTQAGHRDEAIIPASALGAPDSPITYPDSADGANHAPIPSAASHPLREWAKEVLTGVAFLLALAAFVLSVRNNRMLREMREKREKD